MDLSRPAPLVAAAGVFLLLALLPSPAAAQAEPVMEQALDIAVVCQRSFLFPAYAGQDEAPCEVQDLSRDSLIVPGVVPGASPTPHVVKFSYVTTSNNTAGWQVVLSHAVAYPIGGQRIPFTVNVKATPVIQTQDFTFNVIVTYEGPGGHNSTHVVPFFVEVNSYDFAVVTMNSSTISQKAGQDDIVRYEVLVSNVGVYPDSYRFSVKTDPDLQVTIPPNLYVPPGETRGAFIQVLTPHSKVYEIGRSTAINVKVQSVGMNGGSGVYSTVGVLQIRGSYIPLYWIPLLVVGAVSASVVVRGTREKTQMRRLEAGRPRRVELSPRQAVLLAEMRRTSPETYKDKRQALDTVYRERVSDYRAHHKEVMAADKEEARQAKIEFAAQRRTRKEQRAAEKVREKEERKAAKRALIAQRHEAKLLKKKEKTLAKRRKILEKAKAKADAKAAKLAAKQAKLDEKALKKEQAAQKKAAKDARKQKK